MRAHQAAASGQPDAIVTRPAALGRESPFAILTALARAVSGTLELSDVLQRIATAAVGLLPDSAARIWVVEDGWLRLRAEAGTRGPSGAGARTELAIGEGMTGYVALTHERLVVEDVLAEPRTPNAEWMREQGYVSAVVIPLQGRDELVGVLLLLTRHRHRFTPEELDILDAFASQAAVAVVNARLFTETDRRRRAAEALAEVGRVISRSLDSEEVGQRIADSITSLLQARVSALYRLDPASGDAVAIAVSDNGEPAVPGRVVLPRGTGAVGVAVRERAPMVTTNVLTDPRVTLSPEQRAWLERAPYRAVLAVPITIQDRVVGALGVADRAGRLFGREEVRLAQAFADQAAIALENARLFTEQRHLLETARIREARLQAVLNVSRELARIQPLESLFHTVATTCTQLLEADSAGIRLVEGDELVMAGIWGDARGIMLAPRLKIGESVSGLVAATGQPIVVADPGRDPRLIPSHREALGRLGYAGLLVVPIALGEQVAGVLSVQTRKRGGFTAEDVAVVTALASHAAVALENNRLYTEARRAYDELSQTQSQLIQAQKMQAVGQLAGGIAHDFNNLMTVITGRAQLLLRQLRPGDPLRRDVDAISATAQRATDLTRQLLAFSRKQVLEPKVLNLNQVVADLAPMLRRLIGDHVELVTALDPDLGQTKADPRQLEQVLMNLALNARDALPDGGRITLETANVVLDADYAREHVGSRPGPHVMLAVSDTGRGMDAETLARIFEPFFTTKGPGKGTGLGLATVYGIVKQSGGNIWVYSEVGRGTTFKIYLPRVFEAPDVQPPAPAPTGMPRGQETILLVEDDETVRHLARDILTAQGYNVLEATHGGEALLLAGRCQGPIHLLLTDVVMPHMSGRALADRLATTHPETKVLYMSGYTENAVVHHGVLDGETVYIQKPFTVEGLARKVREVLDADPALKRPASA